MSSRLNSILHPHHVSLIRQPYNLASLFHSFADHVDPYFEYDRMPSLKGLSAPRFNVTETETEYLLDGELPGITNSAITVEWLQNQVLMIHGMIKPSDTETATDPFQKGELENKLQAPKEHTEAPPPTHEKLTIQAMTEAPRATFPRQLLRERHIGPFQRSFTFPDEVDADNMKANLKDGLLRVVVPKKKNLAPSKRKVPVE